MTKAHGRDVSGKCFRGRGQLTGYEGKGWWVREPETLLSPAFLRSLGTGLTSSAAGALRFCPRRSRQHLCLPRPTGPPQPLLPQGQLLTGPCGAGLHLVRRDKQVPSPPPMEGGQREEATCRDIGGARGPPSGQGSGIGEKEGLYGRHVLYGGTGRRDGSRRRQDDLNPVRSGRRLLREHPPSRGSHSGPGDRAGEADGSVGTRPSPPDGGRVLVTRRTLPSPQARRRSVPAWTRKATST